MTTHPKIIFIVVCAMAIFVLFGMAGSFVLILRGKDAAQIMIISSFATFALGQLGGMLNNTRTTPSEPIQTQVVNTANNPVETTDSHQT